MDPPSPHCNAESLEEWRKQSQGGKLLAAALRAGVPWAQGPTHSLCPRSLPGTQSSTQDKGLPERLEAIHRMYPLLLPGL